MPSYKCRHCEAYNQTQGRCVLCRKPLGDLTKAINAAATSSVILAAIWIILSLVTGYQFTSIAAVFGATVSFCTTHFSGGRGITHQLIATTCTILGFVAADSFYILTLYLESTGGTISSITTDILLEEMIQRFLYDPFTTAFYLFGIVGGLWIWK